MSSNSISGNARVRGEESLSQGGCVDLAWCGSPFEPRMLAVAAARENAVHVWRAEGRAGAWAVAATLACGSPVRSVAWCPNFARLDPLIAVACRDDVTLWSLHFPRVCVTAGGSGGSGGSSCCCSTSSISSSTSGGGSGGISIRPGRTPPSPLGSPTLAATPGAGSLSALLPVPPALVPAVAPGARPEAVRVCRLLPQRSTGAAPWQLQWGVFGTRIACMYDDGTICVWKIIAPGTWELTSEIHAGDDDGDDDDPDADTCCT